MSLQAPKNQSSLLKGAAAPGLEESRPALGLTGVAPVPFHPTISVNDSAAAVRQHPTHCCPLVASGSRTSLSLACLVFSGADYVAIETPGAEGILFFAEGRLLC